MHRVGLGHRRSAPALLELDARLVFSRTPLCPMSRVTPFSHTPTPAGEISRPRTQAVLNARVRLPGDRGVREWASSPKARERTCFLSSFRPCASLSACGARSARERAWRRRNPRAFGRDTARATQPARIIAPHRAAPCKLIGFLRAVHKRRHRTFSTISLKNPPLEARPRPEVSGDVRHRSAADPPVATIAGAA